MSGIPESSQGEKRPSPRPQRLPRLRPGRPAGLEAASGPTSLSCMVLPLPVSTVLAGEPGEPRRGFNLHLPDDTGWGAPPRVPPSLRTPSSAPRSGFGPFLNWVVSAPLSSESSPVFCLHVLYLMGVCKHFLPVCGLLSVKSAITASRWVVSLPGVFSFRSCCLYSAWKLVRFSGTWIFGRTSFCLHRPLSPGS